jgi:hypothetical protein
MSLQNTNHHWVFEWRDDSGDLNHDILEMANSAEEAREVLERILTGVTWTPEDAEEFGGDQTEPAYTVLVRDTFHGDIPAGLLGLQGESITFRCDEGTLTVERKL